MSFYSYNCSYNQSDDSSYDTSNYTSEYRYTEPVYIFNKLMNCYDPIIKYHPQLAKYEKTFLGKGRLLHKYKKNDFIICFRNVKCFFYRSLQKFKKNKKSFYFCKPTNAELYLVFIHGSMSQ